jgi:hypothetical protein
MTQTFHPLTSQGTSAAFFGLCIIACFVRFYVRFRVQKEIGWDDGFLIFGLCCLISGGAMIFTIIDSMYETEAVVFGLLTPSPADMAAFVKRSVRYRKFSATSLILMWCSICSVKLSFLMLFKKLIRHMPSLTKYWWFTLVFNILVTGYGVAVYVLACPYFGESKMKETSTSLSNHCGRSRH